MAAVHGPQVATHPSPFRHAHALSRSHVQPIKVHPAAQAVNANPNPPLVVPTANNSSSKAGASSSSSSSSSDPFYGHEFTARLCARFVCHLFACPDLPPPVATGPRPPLANFIAYALHRTRLHASVTFAALYLLARLKARFPAARGSCGHRLFISAFMIASKVICDDTYSNKSWCIVGQGMYQLREVNQMEREMCSYLEWELNVDPGTLKDFETKVKRDFAGAGPYPTYNVPAPTSTHNPAVQSTISKPDPVMPCAPVIKQHDPVSPPPSTSKSSSASSMSSSAGKANPLPHHRPPISVATVTYDPKMAARGYCTPPSTPDTPSPSYSATSSPALSASPPTPPDGGDVVIADPRYYQLVMMSEADRAQLQQQLAAASSVASLKSASALASSRSSKVGKEAFAYATPAKW